MYIDFLIGSHYRVLEKRSWVGEGVSEYLCRDRDR